MSTKLSNKEELSIFYCKAHEKSIHYFKSKQMLEESPCWDCYYDANKKKASIK